MTQQVPCAHCGLPAPAREDDAPSFCCVGCEAVYHALSEAGLEHFYELQGKRGQRPAEGADPLLSAIEDQVITQPDGTCEVDVLLDGVHCAGCVWLVERMPQAVDGVVDARLNLSRAHLKVRWRPQDATIGDISLWLQQFGYVPNALDGNRGERTSAAERKMLVHVGMTWALAANVMLIAVAFYSGLDTRDGFLFTAGRWMSLVLTAFAILAGGREFIRRAWGSIVPWAGLNRLSVDVPISVGILGGFAFSAWSVVSGGGEVYFDSISVLIAALLTARWLQMRGRRFASHSAERLLRLLPTRARKIQGTQVIEVAADSLQAGDLVEVRLGDVFPGDGVLVSESGARVHRAVLTGESRPEFVAHGGEVHAGETNVGGVVNIRIHASGKETRVGQILQWVEEASDNRAPIAQLADTISGWFVVVVLAAAVLTFAAWWWVDPTLAIQHTVALLVISCPCALGMATPLALTVGIGKAAREGIFIKHDDVIQAIRSVDIIVFDKTGTVTSGETALVELGGIPPEMLRLAAAVEAQSHHPYARAFTPWQDDVQATHVVEHAGRGIQGRVDGKVMRIGRPDWLGAEVPDSGSSTPVALEYDGKLLGVVRIGDPIRAESAAIVAQLKARGVEPVILSGDHDSVVQAVAATVGIDAEHAHAAQTPEMKLAFVQQLRAQGRSVAMVGDGVNDAAALQAADVGVAVQGGTDLNLVAADVFLTRPGLSLIANLFTGSDGVMRVVKRNLIGSALYNAFGISLAAAGLVNPLVAAVAMPISSISVVLSSLVQDAFRSNVPASQTTELDAQHQTAAAE